MTKLRSMLAVLILATGCTPPPAPAVEKTAAEKAAMPAGSCICKSSSCLCSHCSTGKGLCACKK